VPLAPLVEPARPDPRTVAVNPPETAPAKPGTITRSGNTRTNAPPVRRSAAKKSDLAKKREALDDLLPP